MRRRARSALAAAVPAALGLVFCGVTASWPCVPISSSLPSFLASLRWWHSSIWSWSRAGRLVASQAERGVVAPTEV